jgi:hypothetical protein
VGATGEGKSSTLNAAINEEEVLPISSHRASTSIPTELSYNYSEDPEKKYAADVEFNTAPEWKADIDTLLDQIKYRPKGEKLDPKSDTESGSACAKIIAIYPNINIQRLPDMTLEQVFGHRGLSHILGQTLNITHARYEKFSDLIGKYIDNTNSNSSSEAYWPLLKQIKVYHKHSSLAHGVVWLDLPGVGDSNAGRRHVAEAHLASLDKVFIFAVINRAVSDQVARQLLSSSFKTKLLTEGKYNEDFVTFVTTKTDCISVDNITRKFNLQKVIRENEKKVPSLKIKRNELHKHIQTLAKKAEPYQQIYQNKQNRGDKRKLTDFVQPVQETQSTKNKGEVFPTKKAYKQVCREIIRLSGLHVCIRTRNQWVNKQMGEIFRHGYLEMRQDFNLSNKTLQIAKSKGAHPKKVLEKYTHANFL